MRSKRHKGGPLKEKGRHYAALCIVCGTSLPPRRWNHYTCDDICQRASRHGNRSRLEQVWHDMNL